MNASKPASTAARRLPGRRAGLSIAQIVTTARTLPPANLSMNALAKTLGVDPKALNHHVSDLPTLLSLVAQEEFAHRFADVRIADHADWKEACRAFAKGFAEAVYVTGAYAQHLRPQEAIATRFLDMNEAILAKLIDAGFSNEAAVRSVVLLTNVCYAHARDLAVSHSDRGRKRIDMLVQSLSDQEPGTYPHLTQIAGAAIDTYGGPQLDFGISACIDGLATQLARTKAP